MRKRRRSGTVAIRHAEGFTRSVGGALQTSARRGRGGVPSRKVAMGHQKPLPGSVPWAGLDSKAGRVTPYT